MTIILMIWLMMMGCPKETLITMVICAGLIEGAFAGVEDGSFVFLIIFAVIFLVIYLIAKSSEASAKNTSSNPHNNANVTVKKESTPITPTLVQDEEIEKAGQEFISYMARIKNMNPNDSDYPYILFRLGLLYEKLYKDYFKSAAYVYLSTVYDKHNKEYEKEYLRLCKLLSDKKGELWEYYVTLVNNIDDIEKYADELLRQENTPKKQERANIVTPKPKPINHSPTHYVQSENKFEDFNPESYLHSLGYKVGKTGLSQYQRRILLKKAIESGKISKYDVIETLERNISMFQHRSNRKRAVEDWWEDLHYVRNNF